MHLGPEYPGLHLFYHNQGPSTRSQLLLVLDQDPELTDKVSGGAWLVDTEHLKRRGMSSNGEVRKRVWVTASSRWSARAPRRGWSSPRRTCVLGARISQPSLARKGETGSKRRGHWTKVILRSRPFPNPPPRARCPAAPFPVHPLLTSRHYPALLCCRLLSTRSLDRPPAPETFAVSPWPRPRRLSIGRPAILFAAYWLPQFVCASHFRVPALPPLSRERRAVGHSHWLTPVLVSCPKGPISNRRGGA